MKTVSARIRGSKSDLEELGEGVDELAQGFSKYAKEIQALTGFNIMVEGTTDQFKDLYDIFEGIAAVWDKLSDTQQARTAEILGGTRQLQVIASIIGNWGDAANAYSTAMNSAGAATKANDIYMETAAAHIAQLKATFQELAMNLVSSGLIKFFVDIANALLNFINTLTRLHLLLPAIVATIVAIKGFRIAKSVKSIASTLMVQKVATDGLRTSIATLTEAQKRALKIQIEQAVIEGKITEDRAKEIIETYGLAGAEGTLTATNATLAASFKALWASIPVWGKIAIAVEVVVSVVSALVSLFGGSSKSIQELDSELDELISDAKNAASEFSSLKASVDDVLPRFAELAKGVDSFGKNVSLTDEEYAEFWELNNKLAEMFPELDMGLDSNGNHILALSYSVDTLTESIKALIEAERQAANESIADKMEDTLDNMDDANDAYDKQIDKLVRQRETLEAAYQKVKGMSPGDSTSIPAMPAFRDAVKGLGVDVSSGGYQTHIYNFDPDEVARNYENQLASLERQIDSINSRRAARWAKLNPIVGAWLQTEDSYSAAEDNVRELLTKIIGNIDYSNLDITDDDDLKEFIKTNYIDPITAAEPEVQNAIASLFDIKSAFDSGEISVGDYGIVDYILRDLEDDGVGEEILSNIKISLGVDEFDEDVEFVKERLKELSPEYAEIVSYYNQILREIEAKGVDVNKTVFGNIDTNNRQILEWTEENLIKYADEIKSWGESADDLRGSISTVFGSSDEFDGVEIAFSPILQTENGAVLLDSETVYDYIYGLIDKAGEGWTNEDLLRLDAEGLEIDGRRIKNMIADIGDSARETGEVMHYVGEDGALNGAYKLLQSIASELGITVDELLSDYSSVEDYINSLSGTELKLAYKILQSDGSMTIDELRAKIQQMRYEASAMLDPLNVSGLIEDLDTVAGSVDKITSAMEKLANGTALSKKELLDLIAKYPELIQQANLFADGSVEAQQTALNAILDMKEQEYDAEIDVKIAELEATKQLLDNQLELEAQKATLIEEIKSLEVNGKVTQEAELVDKIKELNDLQGQNYVKFKEGELQVNEEALNDQIKQGIDFGVEASEDIWEPYAKTIVSAHEQGGTGGLKASGSFFSKLGQKASGFVSKLGTGVANAWKDMWSGNWKGIGSYFGGSNWFFGGGNSVSGNADDVVVNFGGSTTTIGEQTLDDWISKQEKASQTRIAQIEDIRKKTINAIENLQSLKGLKLKDIYASGSKSGGSGSGSGSSGSSSSSDDENVFKTLYNYHKHLIEMEQETTGEFLKWLDDAYKDAYKQGEITLDEYYKYEEEVFKGLRTLEKNAKSAIDSLVDYRIKMLKQGLSDEKDNLKKRLDALKDFYDKQKQLLQDAADEEKYLDDQAEKRKSVTEIQAELAQLERDNSAWAQKRKLQLQQDLAEAQKELDEFERDHALELALDALDNAYDEQQARIQAEMDALEEKLNDPQALFNQALEDIKNNTLNTYNEMIKFNRANGDGKDETIEEMWEEAFKANEEYKAANGSGYNGINIGNYTGYTTPTASTSGGSSGSSGSGNSGSTTSSSSSSSSSKPKLDDDTKRKVAAAIWNGGYGWGHNPERAARLTEVFGADNGIQALVNKNVGKNDRAPGSEYTYLNMRKKFKGYALGTRSAAPGLHAIDELGTETIFQSANGTRYKMFTGGEKVLNAKASNFLYDFANQGRDILDKLVRSVFGGTFGGVTPPVTHNEITMGNIVIQGNADNRTVSEIRRAQRDSVEDMLKAFNRLNK